jgi:hypothetical protein
VVQRLGLAHRAADAAEACGHENCDGRH